MKVRILTFVLAISIIMLTGCGEPQTKTFNDLEYVQMTHSKVDITRTQAIFKSPNGELIVFLVEDDEALAPIIKGYKYDVTVTIADTLNNGDCILSMKVKNK